MIRLSIERINWPGDNPNKFDWFTIRTTGVKTMRINSEIQNQVFATMVKNGKIKAERRNGVNHLIPLFTLSEFVDTYRTVANVRYDAKNPPRRQNGEVVSETDFDKTVRRQIRNNLIPFSINILILNSNVFKIITLERQYWQLIDLPMQDICETPQAYVLK